MNEKDIIKNLKMMKEIKPEKSWVLSNKIAIIGEEETHSILAELKSIFGAFSLSYKLAFSVFLLLVSFGSVGAYAQNALPGDTLYTVKKITEKAQFALKSGDESTLNFEVAQRRLDDLDRVIRTNSARNLAPAINEVQATVSEASKSVKVAEIKDIKTVSEKITNIEERQDIIRSFGIEIGENKDLSVLKEGIACKKTEDLLSFTKTRTLTERQGETLEKVEELIKEGKCLQAEEKMLVEFNKDSIEDRENGEEVDNNETETVENSTSTEDIGTSTEEKE